MDKRVLAWPLLLLLLTGCATAPETANSPAPAADKPAQSSPEAPKGPSAKKSDPETVLSHVLLLKAFNDAGEEIGLGSGFLHKGSIVTNAHVIADASWVQVFDADGTHVTTAPYAVHVDTENDLAVLPFPGNDDTGLPLASQKPRIGDDILAYGAPMGFQNTVSKGNISSLRGEDDNNLIQITAPISTGSSGGPVTNTDGEVIGVVVATYSEGQNINFAVPIGKLPADAPEKTASVAFPAAADLEGDTELTSQQNFMLFSAVTGTEISYGDNIKAEFTPEDWMNEFYIKVFYFEGQAGQKVELGAVSDAGVVDLMLYNGVFDDSDFWSEYDTAGGLGKSSILRTELPADDLYFVAVLLQQEQPGEMALITGDLPSFMALGERWVSLSQQEEIEIYVDRDSIERNKGYQYGLGNSQNTVTAWYYLYHTTPDRVDGKEYYASMMQFKMFCNEREYEIHKVVRISEDGTDETSPYPSRESVTPETNGETMWRAVCDQ